MRETTSPSQQALAAKFGPEALDTVCIIVSSRCKAENSMARSPRFRRMSAWPHGRTAAWPHGRMAAWLLVFAVPQKGKAKCYEEAKSCVELAKV